MLERESVGRYGQQVSTMNAIVPSILAGLSSASLALLPAFDVGAVAAHQIVEATGRPGAKPSALAS